MKLGFIGLGHMGAAVAANLVRAGHDVSVFNRSPGKSGALIGKAGVDRRASIECLASTLFNAPAYKTYGGLIAQGKFEPAAFAAPLGYKDIRLALSAAESLHVPMPLASLLHDRFLRLLAQGGDHLDWSAVGGLAAQDAGIGPSARPASMSSVP